MQDNYFLQQQMSPYDKMMLALYGKPPDQYSYSITGEPQMAPVGAEIYASNLPPPGAGPYPTPDPNAQGANGGLGAPVGGVGGMAAGQYAANQLIGPPEFVGPPGAAPSAPTGVMGTVNGTGLTMGPGEFIGPTAADAGGLANTGIGASVMPYAAPLAAALIGGYTLNKGANALKAGEYSSKNPLTGLKEGIKEAGALNFVPVLGQLPWLAGAAGAMFGSGKDKDQHRRDVVRSQLVEGGFLNPDFSLDLPDGSKFDVGKDGNARLDNLGTDPLTGQTWRHYYDVDWSNPEIGGIVAAINPLAAFLSKGDKKLTSDYAGYLTNAAMSSGNPIDNIMHFIEKTGLDHDKLYGGIHLLSKSQGGNLDDNLADAYKNALDQLYGVGAYEGQGNKFGTPDISPGQKPSAPNKPAAQTQSAPKPTVSAPAPKPQIAAPAIKPREGSMMALGNAAGAPTKTPEKLKPRGLLKK